MMLERRLLRLAGVLLAPALAAASPRAKLEALVEAARLERRAAGSTSTPKPDGDTQGGGTTAKGAITHFEEKISQAFRTTQ
eukprot:4154051-Pleurochrysis_carterae.AAC.1